MRYSIALLLAVCAGLTNITQVQATKITADKKRNNKRSRKNWQEEILEDDQLRLEMEDPKVDKDFTDFAFRFHKSLKTTDEKQHRKFNFLKNKRKIEEFKQKPNKTSTVDLNELADLDEDELQQLMSLKLDPVNQEIDTLVDEEEILRKELRQEKRKRRRALKKSRASNNLSLIESDSAFSDFEDDYNQLAEIFQTEEQAQCEHEQVFWTGDNGWMLDDVQNQGKCGSCWAYTAGEAMEAALAIKTGSFIKLSIQYMVDCITYACDGGLLTTVFDWSIANPIPERDKYRDYDGTSGTCATPIDQLGVSAIEHVEVDKTKLALIEALHKQPIAGAVQADSSDFVYYSGGLISGEDCGHSVNHAIMIVGYGCLDETNTDYFLVKNSWGSAWGDKGFVRIAASLSEHVYGTCGIFRLNSYPSLDKMKVQKITVQPDSTDSITK